MKLSDGTDIDNYSIEQLVKLRDNLNSERLLKLQSVGEKQSLIMQLQDEIVGIQKDAIVLGDDVIAVSKKLIDAVNKAQVNN